MHITYSLKDSIPKARITKLKLKYADEKNSLNRKFNFQDRQPDGANYKAYRSAARAIELRHYIEYDNLLDKRREGPRYLSDDKAQEIIIDSWHHIARQYKLVIYAICVMSNHVHVILRAIEEDAEISPELVLSAHKRFTGTKINRLLGRKGLPVWSRDFFDRDIREGAFTGVLWYVLKNPVKAGITQSPFTYSGTWFDSRLEEEYIGPYRYKWE